MTIRRLLPYIITVILFGLAYWGTMIIPDKIYLTVFPGDATRNITRVNKIPLQREIFISGLIFTLFVINLLEIVTTNESNFPLRLLKSFLTIVFVYAIGTIIYQLLGRPHIWNLYYYYRGAPAGIFALLTIFVTMFGLIALEIIQRLIFLFVQRINVAKHIPAWLRLEK